MNPGPVSCLWYPDSGVIVAVQDSFGPVYRHSVRSLQAHQVYKGDIRHHDSGKAITRTGESSSRFRVLEPVHANTVRAVLRRAGIKTPLCSGGYWYRVMED